MFLKVLLLSLHDLSVVNEWQMPDPLSFREEGGTSMHPDGTRFITVCSNFSRNLTLFIGRK
jgi:hypothetical protein